MRFNGNWHEYKNQQFKFSELDLEELNYDIYVRRGNQVHVFIENTETDDTNIVIRKRGEKTIHIHRPYDIAMKELYAYFEENDLDIKRLTLEEIYDRLAHSAWLYHTAIFGTEVEHTIPMIEAEEYIQNLRLQIAKEIKDEPFEENYSDYL